MKKFVCLLVIVGVLGFFAYTPAEAGCRGPWKLYDDFDSGVIDPSLWEIFGPANITVENKMLRIELPNTPAGTNTGLLFNKNPERIKAIKVMAMVESSTGNLHTRIGRTIGEDRDGNRIFKRIAIRSLPSLARIDCWAGYTIGAVEYALHYAHLGSPIEPILGVFFEMGMNFNRRIFTSWAEGLGKNYFVPQERLLPTNPPLNTQIGTRSGGVFPDTASGVVYFDDVYVRYW